jgi:hypothetical protein
VYSTQQYAIKFISDLRQVDGFLVFTTNKTDHHDIADILLKVVLNIITLQNQQPLYQMTESHQMGEHLIFLKLLKKEILSLTLVKASYRVGCLMSETV